MSNRNERLISVFERVDGAAPGAGLAKHKKMATSPFVFLRGASSIFYDDIASGTLTIPQPSIHWPITAIIGDCHISNFGLLSEEGSHGNQIIFAPNDFDDCSYGNAIWDLSRFIVSLILCADHCLGMLEKRYTSEEEIDTDKVINQQDLDQAINAFLDAYGNCCKELTEQSIDYDKVINQVNNEHILHKAFKKARARARGGEDFEVKSSLAKAIDFNQRPFRFINREDRFKRLPSEEYEAIQSAFAPYVDDAIIDIVARLGSGTGSVNMDRYYLLVGPEGKASPSDLPLFHIVEVKKQRAAAALHEFSHLSPINSLNPAHLTAVCQRRMQRDPDLLLDEVLWRDAHWLVRSRHHAKVGIDPEDICFGKKATKGGFADYAAACGQVLALAHGRVDRRSQRFEQAVSQSLQGIRSELIQSAYTYCELVKSDWQDLVNAESK